MLPCRAANLYRASVTFHPHFFTTCNKLWYLFESVEMFTAHNIFVYSWHWACSGRSRAASGAHNC